MFFADDVVIAGSAYNEIAITLGIKPMNGLWETFDGEQVPYFNWNPIHNEPNGGSNNNLIAYMYTKQAERERGADYSTGTWNDHHTSDYSILCTYEPSVHGQLL